MLVFFVAPQTAKFAAPAPDKLLIMLEEALNFCVSDTNIQRVSLFITLYIYLNVGNALLCVIYQLKLTVFHRSTK